MVIGLFIGSSFHVVEASQGTVPLGLALPVPIVPLPCSVAFQLAGKAYRVFIAPFAPHLLLAVA